MVTVGPLVRFDALPGREDEFASFPAGALPLVNDEASPLVRHAIRVGPSTFGIFDAFPDEAGREGVECAEAGEDIVIARSGKPVARLVAVAHSSSLAAIHGALRGRVRFEEDFDELPDDIADAFGAR
jgi:antitoxin (DNA-binding transcriptional repressor) of toxin-antitoxin stability system